MYFYSLVALLGLFGALSDVCVDQWIARGMDGKWWILSACLFVLFMTGLGYCIRMGATYGYSLSVVVITVVLANIIGVIVWDIVIKGIHLTPTQVVGIVLAVGAFICLERK
jgi:drug/metabolite transporter (DMT)-like permease